MWQLALGFILGLLAAGAVRVVSDYLIRRPVDPKVAERFRPTTRELDAVLPHQFGRRGAADILGYKDLGGYYHGPTHPITYGAPTSTAALAAWDARHGKRETA